MFLNCTPAFSAHVGKLEYNDVLFDYSKLNSEEILYLADEAFYQYNLTEDEILREKMAQDVMSKYYILTRIDPHNIYPFVQLARMYLDVDKRRYAKEFLSTALNIEADNPYINYYYGEFYFKYRDYRKAIKHYLVAYKNGYENSFDLNLKMAILYEKFGDILKSIEFYEKASLLNPQMPELNTKLQSLRELNYINSEYYGNSIRE